MSREKTEKELRKEVEGLKVEVEERRRKGREQEEVVVGLKRDRTGLRD